VGLRRVWVDENPQNLRGGYAPEASDDFGGAPSPEVIRRRRAPQREQTHNNKQSSHVMTIALE
jgi:hypothetical protein